ncbi:MAG: tRNA (guanosine(37)-N1)-methyltransferase TrmD [Bacillota bacterium]|nr:tRNA (guanosine(37)-N1)-methyltransferase TrmD [Bacillota bacterium]
MRVDVATIFPGMFAGPLGSSIAARAQEAGLVDVRIHDLRDYTCDRHRTVDDYPYGGGAGMVMKPEPFFDLVETVTGTPIGQLRQKPRAAGCRAYVVLFSPAGRRIDQSDVRRLARMPWLILLCGHYEGIDERVSEHLVDEELSLGDFVLTGGELPAMVLLDALIRQLPGALGDASLAEESFTSGLLEYPQYTRPASYRGYAVPEVLLSGDHGAVAAWRRQQALRRTAERRPDLLAAVQPAAGGRAAGHLRGPETSEPERS